MIGFFSGCHQPIVYTDGPQARWGDAAVYVDATDDVVLAVNNAQQNIYILFFNWPPHPEIFVLSQKDVEINKSLFFD